MMPEVCIMHFVVPDLLKLYEKKEKLIICS